MTRCNAVRRRRARRRARAPIFRRSLSFGLVIGAEVTAQLSRLGEIAAAPLGARGMGGNAAAMDAVAPASVLPRLPRRRDAKESTCAAPPRSLVFWDFWIAVCFGAR
jgi:hypothetical protein